MSGAHWPRARARAHELENLRARAGARPKYFKVSASATNFDERTKALLMGMFRKIRFRDYPLHRIFKNYNFAIKIVLFPK